MAEYRCPVCKKALTKTEYESALGIMKEKEIHLKHRESELKKREAGFNKQKKLLIEKAKKARGEGIKAGLQQERDRTKRLIAGQDSKIKVLQERIKQIERGSTPQTEGLEFEEILLSRLQKEYPDDDIQHEGKGGDILHFVFFNEKQAGIIVYECKRTPSISSSHIQQTFRAKQEREADFAILVTTGKKKKFSGLSVENGVLIVAPLGVIPLVSMLRTNLIEMLKLKIEREKRKEIAGKLLKFISSPQFKNPLEEIINRTENLATMIRDEARNHFKTWETRWNYYQKIKWNSTQIQSNLQLVLHGKEPRPLEYPKPEPLKLMS